ncbi:MAG: metallophosphoesterase, partial [Halioglobus sp.]
MKSERGAPIYQKTDESQTGDVMKITIVSDTHGNHDQITGLSGDVLIHCGDMFNQFDMFGQEDEQFEGLDAWFGRQDFDLVLCTGGNHDFELEKRVQYVDQPF